MIINLSFWGSDGIHCIQVVMVMVMSRHSPFHHAHQISLDFNIHLAWKSSSRHLVITFLFNTFC
uniref:Uncharacterized protein n=1 Tax=Daphnia magna TaxID=35525 RepID=A0A0P5F2L4_9CRUS